MREVKKMKKDRIKFMLDVQKWKQMSMEDLANHIPVVIMATAMIAGVIAYIMYIVNGGYLAQIAAIKEYGFISTDTFTAGTTGLVFGGIAGNIILLLLIAELVVLSLNYCGICKGGKKTALIVSGVLILVQIAVAFVLLWIRIGRVTVEPNAVRALIFNFPEVIMYVKPVGITYTILTVGALIVFFGLLLAEAGSRGMVTFTAEAMIFAKVVVPIVVWILENILALGAAVIGCIFIFVVILGIGKLLLDGLASAGSGGEGSGQSASSFEAGGSSGYSESRSEKRSEPKRDNRTPREKDKNPNHHYIANYQETGGIKLYKVHNSMGNYVELDNSVVSRKVCSLADAEKGKHRFYRENSGQEIRLDDIPWKKMK